MIRTMILASALLSACAGTAASSRDDAAPACSAGGVVDDGDMQGCEIRVGACCYAHQADACAAAGCPDDRCIVLRSYPGQISCE